MPRMSLAAASVRVHWGLLQPEDDSALVRRGILVCHRSATGVVHLARRGEAFARGHGRRLPRALLVPSGRPPSPVTATSGRRVPGHGALPGPCLGYILPAGLAAGHVQAMLPCPLAGVITRPLPWPPDKQAAPQAKADRKSCRNSRTARGSCPARRPTSPVRRSFSPARTAHSRATSNSA